MSISATGRLRGLLDDWIRRRGPVTPPLTLRYRQIYILPTGFGWLLGLLMSAMLIGSLNFNNNMGLLTTFLVAGLAVNSMLLAYRNLEGLAIRHCAARPVFAGQQLALRIDISDTSNRSRPGLKFIRPEGTGETATAAAHQASVRLTLPTARRGWMKLGRIRLETTHPLGLFRAWSWFWPERRFLVWPTPTSPAPPLPRDGGRQTGRLSKPRPDGEEFHSLRPWRVGDPLHRIAWKSSQRHQTLLSREFQQEQAEVIHLELARAPGADLERRISIVTAWVLQADAEGLKWVLDTGAERFGPERGQDHLHRCLRALAGFGQG